MDYKKLGFKCGLEIHQQLETEKLFCSCPSLVNDPNKADILFSRKLRAVVGETGEIDKAAAHEQAKAKTINYEACSSSSCLVEMDEEPPHPINPKAVETALQVAHLLNAKVVDEIQVMRKTVVDGSNTTGFQRTALVAMDGFIETSKGKVRIPIICLEEEAAKKIKEDKTSITYRLDRLGVPLIEIGTEPDIKDPEHAKETAQKIGMILRSTGKVKRGIGSIRQDVNISIKGHPRVEIKGFQDLKSMPKTIENEIERQKKEKNATSHVRKANPDLTTTYLRPMPCAARMYPETDVIPIKPEAIEHEEIELIEDRINELKKYKIEEGVAKQFVRENKDKQLINYFKTYKNIKPAFITQTLTSSVKEVKKQFNADINPTGEDYNLIFKELNNGKIAKDSVLQILKENKPVKKIISKFELLSDEELEKNLKEIIQQNTNLPFNALIGKAMAKLKGKADGRKIVETLRKLTT